MKLNSLLFTLLIIFSCKSTDKMLSPQNQMELNQLKSDLRFLSSDNLEGRLVGSKGEELAANFISDRFKELGLASFETYNGYQQDFIVNKKPNPHSLSPTGKIASRNVIAIIDNHADQNIVIGAHYDHLGYGHFGTLWDGEPEIHNGADDNASGVSILLDLAKRLQTAPKNNNYIFMSFSGEEMGLWGSSYWVKHPNIDLDKVNYMLNMDMVGRLNDKKSLLIYGTGTSPTWDQVLDKNNHQNFSIIKNESGIGPSDHSSFYLADIPVLHFFTGQHSDYHKPTDDFDKINYEGMIEIADYIENLITAVDGKGKLDFTKTKDESQEVPSFKVTLGVMPDYIFDGEGMRIDGIKDGRPASNANLIKGDIVIKMGDKKVTDMMSYMEALSMFESGQTISIIIIREGKEMEKQLTF